MTTQNPESIRKADNPGVVLDQINNLNRTDSPNEVSVREDAPKLRVVYAEGEYFDDQLDQPLEVPVQIAELTSHLKRRRDELLQKEKDLNGKITSWQASVDARGAATTNRESQLQIREKQLRSLQFHLLQMQNDVIDSQLAMEDVIEHFENTESDDYMKLALELLRFEVLDRFDYISKRWELLHDKLENLYTDQPVRKAA